MSDAPAPPDPQEQGKSREPVGPGNPPPEHRFRPGRSGNPGGRKKHLSVTARMNELLARTEFNGQEIPGGRCLADLLAESLVRRAIEKGGRYAREVLDRCEGKVTQPVDIAGDGERVVTVFYLPTNGRDPSPDGNPPPTGPAGGLPLDPG